MFQPLHGPFRYDPWAMHGRIDRTTKVKNIPDRVSIHERPVEADGTRFGDWEMDTIIGKDGKGAIVTLTERSTNMLIMERLPQGKHPEPLAKAVVRLLFPYRHTIRSITTDNGSEFCCHRIISRGLTPKGAHVRNLVYFADSYASWQKGAIENANKLIRQYIPKGTDFSHLTEAYIRKIQYKINRRPRKNSILITLKTRSSNKSLILQLLVESRLRRGRNGGGGGAASEKVNNNRQKA